MTTQVFGVVGMIECYIAGNMPGSNHFSQGLFHRQHSLGSAGLDMCAELMVISAANQILYRVVGEHDLNGGITPGPGCRGYESLRDDGQKSERELLPYLRLIGGGKDVEDSQNRLNCIVGVQRTQYEVPRFGCCERGCHCFTVAHLADQNDIRVLSQRRAHSLSEARSIMPKFYLFNNRIAVGMLKLKRTLW
jgi:hypothetical protein